MDNNLFSKRLDQLGIKRQVDAAMIVARAQNLIKESLGERGNDNLHVISYKKGILKIAASSSAWAGECRNIEDRLKREPVKKVYYSTGVTTEETY